MMGAANTHDHHSSLSLAESIAQHELLSTPDLINTLLMYLTVLATDLSEQKVLEEYALVKPALLRLYQEDQLAFVTVAKKIKTRLGFSLALISDH